MNCMFINALVGTVPVVAPFLLLDLDGTVRYSASGHKFIHGLDDVAVYSDVTQELRCYKEQGYMIAAVSNQGGVAFGFHTPEGVADQFERTNELLGRWIDFAVFSFTHKAAKLPKYKGWSLTRKPSYGMLSVLEYEMGKLGCLPLWSKSIFVGDLKEDAETAESAGIEFRWAWEFFGRELPREH